MTNAKRRFRYAAKDARGRLVEGNISASSAEVARYRVQKTFPWVLDVVELGPSQPKRAGGRIPRQQLGLLARHLAVMMAAGVPLHRCLNCLCQGDSAALNEVVERVQRDIEGGHSLSHALSQHPRHFPTFWLSLIRAGEESGKLVACLEKLADFEDRADCLRRQVLSILLYPAMMAVVCVGLLGLFFGFLLPRIEEILDLFGGKMPWLTVGLISAARVLVHPLTLLSGPALVYALRWRYRRNARFRRRVDEWALRTFLLPMATARIFYAWSLLLEAGVSLEPQLAVLADVAGNEFLRGRIDDAYRLMKAGTDLYESLAIQEVLPKHALAMVRVGEESGTLASSMRYVARMYEESVERKLTDLATALEPLLIGGMGLVVGLVALATALPILNLVSQL